MSSRALREVVNRAVADADFRTSLFGSPGKALAAYKLSGEERAIIGRLSPEGLYACVGRMAVHKLLPLRVGRRLVIVPTWYDAPARPGDALIRLDQDRNDASLMQDGTPVTRDGSPVTSDSALAFGSGLHPTTRLCLAALEDHLQPGGLVLDLGTGSGVLAIAAARLGAPTVVALDVDAAAVRVARENVVANGVERTVRVERGSLAFILSESQGVASWTADLVVANLTTSLVLGLLREGLAKALDPTGLLVVSGILASEENVAVRGLEAAGLEAIDCRQLAGWTVIVSRG